MIASMNSASRGSSARNASGSPSTRVMGAAAPMAIGDLVEIVGRALCEHPGQRVDGEAAGKLDGAQHRPIDRGGDRTVRIDGLDAVGHREYRHHDGATAPHACDDALRDIGRYQRAARCRGPARGASRTMLVRRYSSAAAEAVALWTPAPATAATLTEARSADARAARTSSTSGSAAATTTRSGLGHRTEQRAHDTGQRRLRQPAAGTRPPYCPRPKSAAGQRPKRPRTRRAIRGRMRRSASDRRSSSGRP